MKIAQPFINGIHKHKCCTPPAPPQKTCFKHLAKIKLVNVFELFEQ